MKQEVLFLLLNEYADWEGAFLAISLNTGVIPGSEVKYIPKVVAPTLDVVRSVGGFRTLPDYSFQTMPADYAALVLVGGMHWQSQINWVIRLFFVRLTPWAAKAAVLYIT